MMVRDLECDPNTLLGPPDVRVVRKLQQCAALDPVFLVYMDRYHGGVPSIGTFNVKCKRYEVGLFLTLFDEDSQLPPPFRAHFDDHQMDERAVNSINYVTDYEHSTSLCSIWRVAAVRRNASRYVP